MFSVAYVPLNHRILWKSSSFCLILLTDYLSNWRPRKCHNLLGGGNNKSCSNVVSRNRFELLHPQHCHSNVDAHSFVRKQLSSPCPQRPCLCRIFVIKNLQGCSGQTGKRSDGLRLVPYEQQAVMLGRPIAESMIGAVRKTSAASTALLARRRHFSAIVLSPSHSQFASSPASD